MPDQDREPIPLPLRQQPSAPARLPVFPEHGPVRSLYLHIPFCFHKCHYCDFYSIVDSRDRQEPFTDRLIAELRELAPRAGTIETVFVGGGTPTLLEVGLWERLLAAMHEAYRFAEGCEWTVECNPETASEELFGVLKAGGVNRISLGAQSFDPELLKTLERWHDPASVPRAIELARSAGIGRQSLDLIYAIPGQTLEMLDADLDRALTLGTEHISAYALTYEPNTAMTMRMRRGHFEPAPEELEIRMFERVAERLAAAGLERYEVSNFAKPGAACAHNMAYWRQHDWLAAGPSASAHIAGARWKNIARLDDYLHSPEKLGSALAPALDYEAPDPRRNLAERIMTGLRLTEGLDRGELLSAAAELDSETHSALELRLEAHSHNLEPEASRITLHQEAYLQADGIASDLMDAVLDPSGD